jgi:hypothetical protein
MKKGKADTRKPAPESESNKAYRRKLSKRTRPAAMTVAALVKDDGVPMAVRHWLEMFIAQGDKALAHSFVERDPNTLEQARLIYDVLESSGTEIGEREFSEEAVDYVEEYLYRLAQASELNLWNLGKAAVAALPVLLECSSGSFTDGDATFTALDSAIQRLTTKQERQDFLRGDRFPVTTEDARNTEAAFKLSRVLANPATAQETINKLEDELIEFSTNSGVTLCHPALARRAFLLMCEAKPKGRTSHCRRVRRRLLDLLDTLPKEKGGEG